MAEQYKTHGAFSWCELMTTDVETATDFYSKLFGWGIEKMPMEGGDYIVVKAGGKEVGGIMHMPPEAKGVLPHWATYVTVDDVDDTAKKAEELGGKILVAPRDIPKVGRFCVIQDPQGAVISAISYKEM